MTDPLTLIPASQFTGNNVGKFAPKLSDAERCAVLALAKSGVRRERIAAAFGIDRRTVGHITNPFSMRYKEVRAKYTGMGHADFVKEYLTEAVAMRMAALPEDTPTTPVEAVSSARSNRMAGTHTVKPEQCSYEHRIEITYLKDGEPPGWYYRDNDSKDDPNTYFHNGADSLKTSHACYDAAVANLMDD